MLLSDTLTGIMVCFVFCINSYFSGQGNLLFPMIHSLIATISGAIYAVLIPNI